MRSIACLGSALLLLSGAAFGQPAPAPGAPPSAQPAPPPAPAQPQQPPYGYPQPYPYAYPYQYPAQGYPPQRPPEQAAPAAVLPYKDGDPIPPGYELVERPRTGLVTTGWILTGISYGISLIAATSADFANSSGWLAVPFAGPWLTLGRRNYHCDEDDDGDGTADDGAACLGDVFVVMGLILDGMMQTAGGTLLLIGYMNQKKELVRQQPAFHLGPTRVGSGYGLGVRGGF